MRRNRVRLTIFLFACSPSVTLSQAVAGEAEFERSSVPIVGPSDSDRVRMSAAGCPEPPCPVCTADASAENCQAANGAVMWSIDPKNSGGAVADDFIAESTQITEFCFSSCWLGLGNVTVCPDRPGASPPFVDQISVRFFEDGANDSDPATPDGFPGTPLPGSPDLLEVVPVSAKELRSSGSQCWDHSIVFDPPITGLTVGRKYWVEWFSAGWLDSEGNGCEVFLETSTSGNGWALRQLGQFAYSIDPGTSSVHAWKERTAEGDLPQDWPFCIDGGLTVPPPMTGACCACDGTCVDDVAWEDCIASSAIDTDGNSFVLSEPVGAFFPSQPCSAIVCQSADSGAMGEDCSNPIILEDSFADMTEFSNLCSTTDGPAVLAACGDGGAVATAGDVWVQFNNRYSHRVDFDVCGGQLDVVTAIYTNGTSTCPHELGECPPSEEDRVFCTAAECPGGLDPTASFWARDTCKGGPNDGQLCFSGENDCPEATCEGQCFLVRLSGVDGDVGTGHLAVWSYVSSCFGISSVTQESLFVEFFGTFEPNNKERFLSFSVDEPFAHQAIRVIVNEVTEPHHEYLVGSEWWVQRRKAIGESGSSADPRPGVPSFWAAPLGCSPYFTDWNGACSDGQCEGGPREAMCFAGPEGSVCTGGPRDGYTCLDDGDCPGESCTQTADCGGGIVHVYGEAVVPGASYSVVAIPGDCDPALAEPGVLDYFSTIVNTARFGHVVTGSCVNPPCGPGAPTTVDDILATIAGFVSRLHAPSKTRTEAEPSALDFVVNITDVLMRVRAFQGLFYPALRCDAGRTDRCIGGPRDGQPCATDVECELELCALPRPSVQEPAGSDSPDDASNVLRGSDLR